MKRTYLIIFSLLLSMSLSAQDMSFDDTDSEDTEMTMSSKHEVYTNSFLEQLVLPRWCDAQQLLFQSGERLW